MTRPIAIAEPARLRIISIFSEPMSVGRSSLSHCNKRDVFDLMTSLMTTTFLANEYSKVCNMIND